MWSALTAIASRILFREPLTRLMMVGIGLIAVGACFSSNSVRVTDRCTHQCKVYLTLLWR